MFIQATPRSYKRNNSVSRFAALFGKAATISTPFPYTLKRKTNHLSNRGVRVFNDRY